LVSTESFLVANPFLIASLFPLKKLYFGKHQHSVMASFYAIEESFIASFDSIEAVPAVLGQFLQTSSDQQNQ